MKAPTRILLVIIGTVAGLLIAIRVIGSPLATRYANRKLAELPGYTGHVDAVQLALWRGTIHIKNFALFDRREPNGPSVVLVEDAGLTAALIPLLKGRFGGHGHAKRMDIRILKSTTDRIEDEKDKDKPEPGAGREWQKALQQAFPLELTRFQVEETTIQFEDNTRKPSARITLDQLELLAKDIANRPQAGAELPATVELTARVGGTGRLRVDVRADPSAAQPRFTVKMDLQSLALVPIKDFIARYGLIDVSQGEFSVFAEVEAVGGHYKGYVKPFFKDLHFRAIPDPEKNLAQRAAAKVASAVVNVLKNDEDKIATKAPFEGDFADNQLEVWTTVENLLRNAFVTALREGIEGQTPDS